VHFAPPLNTRVPGDTDLALPGKAKPRETDIGRIAFQIQARVQTADTHRHLLDKRIVRLASCVKGEQKRVLVSDNLEGKQALKGWHWRDDGTDLAARPPGSGTMAEAARSGKRGFRITDKRMKESIGVRPPFFRQCESTDVVRASACIRQVQGEGAFLETR